MCRKWVEDVPKGVYQRTADHRDKIRTGVVGRYDKLEQLTEDERACAKAYYGDKISDGMKRYWAPTAEERAEVRIHKVEMKKYERACMAEAKAEAKRAYDKRVSESKKVYRDETLEKVYEEEKAECNRLALKESAQCRAEAKAEANKIKIRHGQLKYWQPIR